AVERRPRAERGRVEAIGRGIVLDADDRTAFLDQRHAHAELGHSQRELARTVERVDDPHALLREPLGRVPRLFREPAVVGKCTEQARLQQVVRLRVRLREPVLVTPGTLVALHDLLDRLLVVVPHDGAGLARGGFGHGAFPLERRHPGFVHHRPVVTNPIVRALVIVLATAGGAGYAPIASGTVGSLVALPLVPWLARTRDQSWALGLGIAVGIALLAIWAAGRAEIVFGGKDHSRIVIDEVAGMTTAALFVPATW